VPQAQGLTPPPANQRLKDGKYGADPDRPFMVSTEGGVQVIRGPAISRAGHDAEVKGLTPPTKEASKLTANQYTDESGRSKVLVNDGSNVRVFDAESFEGLWEGTEKVMASMERIRQTADPAQRARQMKALEQWSLNAGMPSSQAARLFGPSLPEEDE
jgi:hypothetical protein